jgi:hypothetical protein
LFGAQVLAEIPDSIRQHSPLSTRNVECTFIHMDWNEVQFHKVPFVWMVMLNCSTLKKDYARTLQVETIANSAGGTAAVA